MKKKKEESCSNSNTEFQIVPGLRFIAKGSAGNEYRVVSVTPKSVSFKRNIPNCRTDILQSTPKQVQAMIAEVLS